ncbi:VENN motif pre-toxin domain-containing protein [Citrobacter europaeus]|nr:VENN motif pre-toxin domain-containing protein [Citrobacter europaeus]MCB8601997.1 VENN motif pre-toxin domain-containing protein [Citrobacter europaeus]
MPTATALDKKLKEMKEALDKATQCSFGRACSADDVGQTEGPNAGNNLTDAEKAEFGGAGSGTPGGWEPQDEENAQNSQKQNITVEDLTSTSSKGPETTGRSKLFERTGGSNAANKEFDALSPTEIKEIPSGRGGKLPDGRTVSDIQRGIQAAVGALQGLAGGDIGAALAGASAPELANIIGHKVGLDEDDIAAKAIAHAILGGAAAAMQGNNAAAGAAGAAAGELAANAILKTMYPGKHVSELDESDRQLVSNLATIASGLAGNLAGGDSKSTTTGAQSGKNAVENNSLSGNRAREAAKQAAESLKNQVREKLAESGTVLR